MQSDTTAIPLPLLRLTSSLLPVGAFAYSRGLEHAVRAEWVQTADALRSWVLEIVELTFAPLDGVVFLRMMKALSDGDADAFRHFDGLLAAARESSEFRREDRRMAGSLLRLLRDMEVPAASDPDLSCETFPGAYALATHDIGAAAEAGFQGLLWTACEAQVSAGMRLGIIGQADAQRILSQAPDVIARCLASAVETPDRDIGNVAFLLAVGSALHEDQDGRLFQS